MRRVGFLFNHDQIHQVAHSLPVALALARAAGDLEIVVATTNDRLAAEVLRLAGGALPPGLRLIQLRPRHSVARGLVRTLEALLPVDKLAIYGDNLDFFKSLDALVVAEKTSLLLKTRYGLDRLRLIHTRHGAGDRAVGFNKASARFDHVLASGRKIRDRLISDAGLAPDQVSVVGYPKFDLMPTRSARLPMQANGRPTVLYNPHVSPHLSSWYRDGAAVLDYFRRSDRYNLIFAPHVMLFQRPYAVSIDKLRIAHVGKLDPRLRETPHIHVDLGGPASTDMTYTSAADLYLGDVSSQVYEFLHSPRPCLFINSHGRRHQDDRNFAHWATGPVIDGAGALDDALTQAFQRQDHFRPIQQQLFDESFDLTDEPSSDRAARVIREQVAGRD